MLFLARLFLQGKFDEAESFIEERSGTRDSVSGSVPIFTHCHAVILFAKAGITGTEEDRYMIQVYICVLICMIMLCKIKENNVAC